VASISFSPNDETRRRWCWWWNFDSVAVVVLVVVGFIVVVFSLVGFLLDVLCKRESEARSRDSSNSMKSSLMFRRECQPNNANLSLIDGGENSCSRRGRNQSRATGLFFGDGGGCVVKARKVCGCDQFYKSQKLSFMTFLLTAQSYWESSGSHEWI
jgi:hypothetical protein